MRVVRVAFLMFFIGLGLIGCAYIVVDCAGMYGTCEVTSSLSAMTPITATIPISAIPSI